MNNSIKKFFFLFTVFATILIIVISLWLLEGIYLSTTKEGVQEKFVIEKRENLFQISRKLEERGWIESEYFFEAYATLKGKHHSLKAGKYELEGPTTVPELLNEFTSGNVVHKKITILEGWNLRDIGNYLEDKNLLQEEQLFEITGFPAVDYSKNEEFSRPTDFSENFDFLESKPSRVGLEGFLFPDTYQIREGITPKGLVRKMLSNFEKRFDSSLKSKIEEENRSLFEVITMASLIEKEVRTLENKKLVSGILWKRLENKVPLQVDATINYVTGKSTTKISKKETEIDSPFNTYKYKGLPLGPICNPGLESIKAALEPKESDYWYYLSTPEKTYFSRTLREHNVKKQKYLH